MCQSVAGCRTSYSPYDLHHNFTLPRAVVEVHVDYLLPFPQRQTTAGERDGERRSQESRAHVRVAVAVTPAFVVEIERLGAGET